MGEFVVHRANFHAQVFDDHLSLLDDLVQRIQFVERNGFFLLGAAERAFLFGDHALHFLAFGFELFP